MLYTTVPGHYNIEDYGAIPDYRGSRTGSTTSGTPTLLVNDATGLTVGQKIAIAGVSDTKTILSISGATVTLSSNADVTVSAASVYTDNHDAFVAALAAMKNDNNEVRKLLISGWYYIGQTLEISQTLVIEGIGDARGTFQSAGVLSRTQPGTWLIFPKNITGLRLKSASTGDPGGQAQSAERTAIRNVTISCLDSSTISGHGIYASIIATYERVTVEGFGENGFYLYAFAGDFSGNADCSYLANCNALGNKLHGYHIEGSEANAITVFASTAFRNGYVGFYDASGAGGSGYFGCHSEGNGTLASAGQKYNYKAVGAGNTSTYFHCYNEDYDNCHFEGFVSIYGGSLPDGLKSTSHAHVVQNGRATSTPYSYLNRRGAAAGGSNVRAILGESPPFSSMGVLAFEQLGTGTDENYRDSLNWVFGGENDPWWITLVQRSGYYQVMRWPTLKARMPAPWFTNGIFLGEQMNIGPLAAVQMRLLASNTNVPTTRRDLTPLTYESGDMVLEGNPTAGGHLLRRCTSAGTLRGGVPGSMPTASTTAGSTSITVSNASGLSLNQRITIDGVTGTKKIAALSGTTLTLDTPASATVSSAAISFVAPTFETIYGATGPSVTTAIDATLTTDQRFVTVTAAGRTVSLPATPFDGETHSVMSGGVFSATISGNGKQINGASAQTISAWSNVNARFNVVTDMWELR